MLPRDHRTAELRSLELHRLIAERLDESLLETARRRVEGWIAAGGPVHPYFAERWREVLSQPQAEIAGMLRSDEEWARDLRQSTPFAGAVNNSERWRIVREVH